jgi:nucleotidyltransferase substrate binding protein (TIGR01987 family)
MDRQRLLERIADYLKAVNQLDKAVKQPKNEFIRDSVIQRFEFTYELAWKMLKLYLESEGVSTKTPKETFQESLQAGLLKDGNIWTDLHKHRNLTTHTYDEEVAEEVYDYVNKEALPLFQQLAEKAKSWQITLQN